jgi:hypothetical protein
VSFCPVLPLRAAFFRHSPVGWVLSPRADCSAGAMPGPVLLAVGARAVRNCPLPGYRVPRRSAVARAPVSVGPCTSAAASCRGFLSDLAQAAALLPSFSRACGLFFPKPFRAGPVEGSRLSWFDPCECSLCPKGFSAVDIRGGLVALLGRAASRLFA